MVADQCPDLEVAVAAAVGKIGGADQSQPAVHHDARGMHAEYPYAPGYYAVFFTDPDGIKLELVHM